VCVPPNLLCLAGCFVVLLMCAITFAARSSLPPPPHLLPSPQCGGHQQLRRALELVAEMRSRGIDANIHTYSALMSVCVKCK